MTNPSVNNILTTQKGDRLSEDADSNMMLLKHETLPTSQSNENKLSKEISNITKERLLDQFCLFRV